VAERFANTASGVESLAAFCRAHGVELVVMEASGGCERTAFAMLWSMGHPCALVNPRQVRRFAEDRGLDVGGSYLEIADTNGLATAYVVTAAYPDRLEAYQWSYPVVGRIPYRGYFDRGEAEAFGRRMESDGLDTHIVEAAGYSTLGWLDDPLPSGLIDYDDVALRGHPTMKIGSAHVARPAANGRRNATFRRRPAGGRSCM